jgi:hypothetical protein
MRPMAVSLCAVSLVLPALGVVSLYGHRRVTLPVYGPPVTFFTEGRQALVLANLPEGAAGLHAADCAGCHRQEHAEWQASAHARSVTEPVFKAAFAAEPRVLCRSCHSPLVQQHPTLLTQGPAIPRSVAVSGTPNPHYDAALANEGVTCVTCHVRNGAVLTAKPTAPADVPHALRYSPMLRKAEFCAGCHQFNIANPRRHPFERRPELDPRMASVSHAVFRLHGRLPASSHPAVAPAVLNAAPPGAPNGAPPGAPHALPPGAPNGAPPGAPNGAPPDPGTQEEPPIPPQPGLEGQYQNESREQQTLNEFHLSAAAARGENCQSCHMPARDGRRQHTWPGRDHSEMLRQAVSLAASLDRTSYRLGDTLQAVIRLRNDAGHRFPTGDSLHAGILDVWLCDGDRTVGRQVFVMSNQNGGGFMQILRGRSVVFMNGHVATTLMNGAGPPEAQSQLEAPMRPDSRLLPGEEAMLVYRQPVTKVLAGCRNLTLRVRLFHSAVNPGFRGSRTDPGINTMRLIREQTIPVRVAPAPDPPASNRAPALEAALRAERGSVRG